MMLIKGTPVEVTALDDVSCFKANHLARGHEDSPSILGGDIMCNRCNPHSVYLTRQYTG